MLHTNRELIFKSFKNFTFSILLFANIFSCKNKPEEDEVEETSYEKIQNKLLDQEGDPKQIKLNFENQGKNQNLDKSLSKDSSKNQVNLDSKNQENSSFSKISRKTNLNSEENFSQNQSNENQQRILQGNNIVQTNAGFNSQNRTNETMNSNDNLNSNVNNNSNSCQNFNNNPNVNNLLNNNTKNTNDLNSNSNKDNINILSQNNNDSTNSSLGDQEDKDLEYLSKLLNFKQEEKEDEIDDGEGDDDGDGDDGGSGSDLQSSSSKKSNTKKNKKKTSLFKKVKKGLKKIFSKKEKNVNKKTKGNKNTKINNDFTKESEIKIKKRIEQEKRERDNAENISIEEQKKDIKFIEFHKYRGIVVKQNDLSKLFIILEFRVVGELDKINFSNSIVSNQSSFQIKGVAFKEYQQFEDFKDIPYNGISFQMIKNPLNNFNNKLFFIFPVEKLSDYNIDLNFKISLNDRNGIIKKSFKRKISNSNVKKIYKSIVQKQKEHIKQQNPRPEGFIENVTNFFKGNKTEYKTYKKIELFGLYKENLVKINNTLYKRFIYQFNPEYTNSKILNISESEIINKSSVQIGKNGTESTHIFALMFSDLNAITLNSKFLKIANEKKSKNNGYFIINNDSNKEVYFKDLFSSKSKSPKYLVVYTPLDKDYKKFYYSLKVNFKFNQVLNFNKGKYTGDNISLGHSNEINCSEIYTNFGNSKNSKQHWNEEQEEGNDRGQKGNNGGGQDNNGRRPQDNNGRRPQDNNNRRPQDNNGRRPQDNNNRRPQDNNGRRPQDNNGRKPQDNNRRPQDNNGRRPQDNNRRPQDNNGRRPQDNNGGKEERENYNDNNNNNFKEKREDNNKGKNERGQNDEKEDIEQDNLKKNKVVLNSVVNKRSYCYFYVSISGPGIEDIRAQYLNNKLEGARLQVHKTKVVKEVHGVMFSSKKPEYFSFNKVKNIAAIKGSSLTNLIIPKDDEGKKIYLILQVTNDFIKNKNNIENKKKYDVDIALFYNKSNKDQFTFIEQIKFNAVDRYIELMKKRKK